MDEKKDRFRHYLDESGMMNILNGILVTFYESPEKPEKPLEYIKAYLSRVNGVELKDIATENIKLKEQLERLHAKLKEMQPEDDTAK